MPPHDEVARFRPLTLASLARRSIGCVSLLTMRPQGGQDLHYLPSAHVPV